MTVSQPQTPLAAPAVNIQITGLDESEDRRKLHAGDTIVIGCSPACGIRIDTPEVAGMHCTISFENGQLTINDWDTQAGTYVDGARIARQVVVEPPTEIRIGECQLSLNAHLEDASGGVDGRAEEETTAIEVALDEEANRPSKTASTVLGEISDVFDEFEREFGESEPDYDLLDDSDESVELLKAEIEFLRSELAERDARLQQSSESPVVDFDEELPTRDEVDALASRLEDLLEELEHSDERLKAMSELLQITEDANLAAEEERSQMEIWIGEVESRVGKWEEEWHAERDALNRTIARLRDERDHAESHPSAAGHSDTIRKLRKEHAALQQQIDALQQERDELSARLKEAEVASVEDRVTQTVDVALREERLQLSQAKAEYARERAQLAQRQEELMCRVESTASHDEADVRIRAFREHLKEIRATEPKSRPAPSMSQRLGKLWRKIDGRPLDTD